VFNGPGHRWPLGKFEQRPKRPSAHSDIVGMGD
jgi:hypothetical protein